MTDFVDSLDAFLQSRLEDLHTMLPGTVQSYDPKTRTATVKPAVKLRSMHADILDIPPIASVPVIWPGSSAFSVMGNDLPTGSKVTLLFSESSLGNWMNSTQDAAAEDETRHSLQDAVAVPGLWPIRLVPRHSFISAAWGMCSDNAEIGGTSDGRVSLSNHSTDLKTEIDKLWDALLSLHLAIQTNFTALSAVAVGPLAPLNPGFSGMNTNSINALLPTALPADKSALGRILA